MYSLGEHLNVDLDKAKPSLDNVIKGATYRFTVLTDRLIRIEYNQEGVFNDEPSILALNRDFPKVNFTLKEDKNYLEITTSYFKLFYKKDKKFTKQNLYVDVLNTDRKWFYNHVEAKNYSSPSSIVDDKIKNYKSLYSLDGFVTIDDTFNKLINQNGTFKESNKQLDIYLFVYLNDFDLCLKDYFYLTGFPSLIPRYALGNWWGKEEDYNDNTLKKLVDDFFKYEIPISIILLDDNWHLKPMVDKKYLNTGFTFNKDNFKVPYEMISYLHSKGIRIGLNINPTLGIYNIDEYYEKAINYLKPDENGVIPYNVLDPKWVDVYLKLFIHPLDALGVDFYFLDCNDFYLKHYQYNDALRNYKHRPLILGYNDKIAQHRYSVLYSGKTTVNWDSLRLIAKYNADAANIGLSFHAHDIGGFHKGIEDSELYIRYVQLATFSPILKFGSASGKYYKREPWRWDSKTKLITCDYLKLRHKLIPYLYSEAYKYHKDGIPLIRPIYYKEPDLYDDLLYRDEYYFGTQFFITPILNKKDPIMDRSVHRFYMPEGIWYDFFTGKKFLGNNNYVAFYKDENYPVFAKAGSIIVMGENENINDTNPPKDMEIHIFPGVSNEYYLYEDDGISNLYKKDFYLLTKVEYNYLPNNYTVIIRPIDGKSMIVPEKRNYKLVFRNILKADEVIVYEDKEQIESNSYVDGPNFIVELKNVSSLHQITINCKGKKIEFDPVHLINNDIEGILEDLQIDTLMKEQIDKVIFSDLPIKKKRIAIRKLGSKGLESKFVKMFLRLLEYISTV